MDAVVDVKVHRLHKVDNNKTLKAFVDIVVNDAILIKSLKIIEGKDGLFVSMPQEKSKDDKWYESVRCLNRSIREQICDVILNAYQG